MDWAEASAACRRDRIPCVLVTVLAAKGSTPRAAGSKMLVTADALYDSIGGGQLEHQAAARARELLECGSEGQEIHHLPLAAAAEQCCGGSVTVLLEVFGRPELTLAVFGAGHVGRRVVTLLAELPIALRWYDNREELLAEAPPGVRTAALDDVPAAVAALPVEAGALVLTHDHALDFRLMQALLEGAERPYLGLIGSTTKWQRFRARLARDGVPDARLDRVRCPVGAADVRGKEPMAVAIAIAAEVLSLRTPATAASALSWRQIRASLVQESP